MYQNSVLYDDLYNRAEYLIFIVSSWPSPSDLETYLPHLSILNIFLFKYILTLLDSNKPVSEHKFKNSYCVSKENFWEKHFWDAFEVSFLVYGSIKYTKFCLPKGSLLDICKLVKTSFFQNTCDLRRLQYFYNWNFRTRIICYLQSVLKFSKLKVWPYAWSAWTLTLSFTFILFLFIGRVA